MMSASSKYQGWSQAVVAPFRQQQVWFRAWLATPHCSQGLAGLKNKFTDTEVAAQHQRSCCWYCMTKGKARTGGMAVEDAAPIVKSGVSFICALRFLFSYARA